MHSERRQLSFGGQSILEESIGGLTPEKIDFSIFKNLGEVISRHFSKSNLNY